MKRRDQSLCICDRHTECPRENTNEYALKGYQESVQYVMYLGILELSYMIINKRLACSNLNYLDRFHAGHQTPDLFNL
jgi:hypothetical protein